MVQDVVHLCYSSTYLSFDDVEVDHTEDHVEPDAMQHLQRAQQAVVCVVDVGHADDHVTFKQRASQDPATSAHQTMDTAVQPGRQLQLAGLVA